jgi:hypothetical protein
MPKPVLPIHEVDIPKFNNDFKVKHLDSKVLSESDLKAIEQVFGLSDRSANSPVGRICCDEAHGHSYSCHYYNSPEAGIVDRLIDEIRSYEARLKQISDLTIRGETKP